MSVQEGCQGWQNSSKQFFCFFGVFNFKQQLTGHRIRKFGYEDQFSNFITTATGNSSIAVTWVSKIGWEAFYPARLLIAFRQS